MSKLITDASVLVKCIFDEVGSAAARSMLGGPLPPAAPDLASAECANAIWKRVRRRQIDGLAAHKALAVLDAVPFELLPLQPLTETALGLALEYDHPVYDCYYLAAAITHDANLATADARLYDLALRVGFGERATLVR